LEQTVSCGGAPALGNTAPLCVRPASARSGAARNHAARGQERATEGSIWQKEYFDRIIRDDAEFEQKMAHVAGNQPSDGRR
jgi:hypothetical protein